MLAAAALCAAALGCAAGARLLSGQTVCRRGTQKPCYKIVYFHDASRRSSYEEAHLACRADGGHLLSIESPAEQRLIESLIRSLLASDGDFWIGLRRRKEEEENSTECHSFYSWSDGSSSRFRNWYADEPSCGGEVCVVLYHQPSAPPGLGGPYMFQWNDDRCTMKNNFICKYSLEKPTRAPIDNSRRAVATEPWKAKFPEERWRKGANGTAGGAKEPVQGLAFILISSIPVLLLLMAITGISCFWLSMRRRQQLLDVTPKGDEPWLPQPSPELDIYRVINKQSEADLAGARPGTKNSSFRAHEGLQSPCRDAEDTSSSGLVTLASAESGFVTNDIYELCGDRVGRSEESSWVDNEIYGY
ncbi:layilin isoform X2 [Onychostruthus taczanowskii]|uniref:layilin isoform X2 n=1 Tax=Onychostruthus taczanowskii TaxID=356909 RepID=UPI001B804A54|nr:layilin isoform X2 [Onychostruthus taczanowskii]